MSKSIICLVILILTFSGVKAQIPNNDFENWIDEYTPENWLTGNFEPYWVTVSRTSSAHTGSYAARMEISDLDGFPVFPVLSATFPVSELHTSFSGYYQFHPSTNEIVLEIFAYFLKGETLIASGVFEIETASQSYTAFNMEIPGSNETPDSVFIQFQMSSKSGTDPGTGSYALIDQLGLGQSTNISEPGNNISQFKLEQNYPNPFNPSTTIEFSIPDEAFVELKVYDVLGNQVAVLVNDTYPAGSYKADFNGDNLVSGIYIARFKTGNFTESFKMMLLK